MSYLDFEKYTFFNFILRILELILTSSVLEYVSLSYTSELPNVINFQATEKFLSLDILKEQGLETIRSIDINESQSHGCPFIIFSGGISAFSET